jgi:ketosteroid isomerase-like protein
LSLNSPHIAVDTFIARINAHDAHGVVACCAHDHVFIDSLGTRISGLDTLESGWSGYFAIFPDYRIEVETMVSADALVLLTGAASATHGPTGRRWRITAAWRARVSGNLIAEWQIYADNKPVYDILSGKA